MLALLGMSTFCLVSLPDDVFTNTLAVSQSRPLTLVAFWAFITQEGLDFVVG